MANYYSNQMQGFLPGIEQQGQDLQNEGQALFTQLGGAGGYQQGASQAYQGPADQAWNQYGQGFNQQQQANILGLNGDGSGLAGVNTLSGDPNQFQFSQGQQNAIMGNPNSVAAATDAGVNTMQGLAATNAVNAIGQAQGAGNSITGSVNPSAFNLDPSYRPAIGQALGTEASTLNSAVNNPNLQLSNQFNQNYQFTPQDAQNMTNAAMLGAGQMYAAQNQQLATQAAAQGNASPLAIAAMQQQNNLQSANSQSQAALNAAVQAKQMGLGVTQTAEQMRLGTAQDIAASQMQAGESLAGTQIGAQNSMQQMALNGAQMGQGLNLQANLGAGQLGQSASQYAGNLMNSAGQYGVGAEQQGNMYADTSGSNRALGLAQNQQQTGMYNQATAYNQNMGVNNAMSNRYQGVYGANQGYLGQYAGAMQNNQQFYQSGANQNWGQQANVYGQQQNAYNNQYNQMRNTATSAYGMQQPGLWSKLGGAAINALGAAASAGA